MRRDKECPDIHISIVSHGQALLVHQLLQDLEALVCRNRFYVILTLNIAEDVVFSLQAWSFPVQVIRNQEPKGFGANHNQAFRLDEQRDTYQYFFILNPDIRIKQDVFPGLVHCLQEEQETGLVAPSVVNQYGDLEDSIRELPTTFILWQKAIGNYHFNHEIFCQQSQCSPDWVAGMFLGLRKDTFAAMKGFDEGYFLYYEDVDLCSRIWLSGLQVKVKRDLQVIHQAQRASHRSMKYFRWHIGSIARFLTSSVYRKVKQFHRQRLSTHD